MRFYHAHTNYGAKYREAMEEALDHKGRYDRDEISDTAKSLALHEWVESQGGREAAALHPNLPPSLVPRVRGWSLGWWV